MVFPGVLFLGLFRRGVGCSQKRMSLPLPPLPLFCFGIAQYQCSNEALPQSHDDIRLKILPRLFEVYPDVFPIAK